MLKLYDHQLCATLHQLKPPMRKQFSHCRMTPVTFGHHQGHVICGLDLGDSVKKDFRQPW